MQFTELEIERQRAANIEHELTRTEGELQSVLEDNAELIARLEATNATLVNMTDTLQAMVDALAGGTDIDIQNKLFSNAGPKPSDYCREMRAILKRLTELGESRTWPAAETLARANRILGLVDTDSPQQPDQWQTALNNSRWR